MMYVNPIDFIVLPAVGLVLNWQIKCLWCVQGGDIIIWRLNPE